MHQKSTLNIYDLLFLDIPQIKHIILMYQRFEHLCQWIYFQ